MAPDPKRAVFGGDIGECSRDQDGSLDGPRSVGRMLAPLLALVVVMVPLSLDADSAVEEGKSFLEAPLPGAAGRDPDLVRALRDRWER